MTLLVVRHARAGRRDKWQGDDRLRPLTKRGRAQADALVDVIKQWLGDGHAVTLRSSPWVRCVQTLDPLAAALGRTIVLDEALGEGMAAAPLLDWLAAGPTVVCTHGDVIEDLLRSAGKVVSGRPWAAKGSVWVLDGTTRSVTRADYLGPV